MTPMNPEDNGINPSAASCAQVSSNWHRNALGPQSGGLSTHVLDEQQNEEFDIDIKTFWHVLVKRRWTIAAAVALDFHPHPDRQPADHPGVPGHQHRADRP